METIRSEIQSYYTNFLKQPDKKIELERSDLLSILIYIIVKSQVEDI